VFVRRFFRELYSRVKPPFTVVLDNYQDVPHDSALHDVMADTIAEIPNGGGLSSSAVDIPVPRHG